MKNLALVLILSAVAACSGGSKTEHSNNPPPPPPPSGVQVILDEGARVATIVGPAGATMSTTDSNGVVYTLTFPPGSVSSDTQISVAPVLSITGSQFDGKFVGALDLRPDGTQFQIPVSLSIDPGPRPSDTNTPIGVLLSDEQAQAELLPVEKVADAFVTEISHFSTGGVVSLTVEEAVELIRDTFYEKFFGELGIVATLQGITQCSDYRFDLLAIKVIDINAFYDDWGAYAGADDPVYVPRQCTGYFGDTPTGCSSMFELATAAREDLGYALEYFTRQATQQCLAGDLAQEGEAFQCIRNFTAWEGIALSDLSVLCDIKQECGIATLEVQPFPLEIAVGESGQLLAIARDALNTELPDREVIWSESAGDRQVAQLSATDIQNPVATGIKSGTATPIVFDTIGGTACPGMSYTAANIQVTNAFVTDAQSLVVPEGETVDLQVKLAYPPEFGVQANLTVSGDPDITIVSGDTLTFHPDDWDQYQTVLLFAYEDDDDVVDGTALLTIEDTRVAGGLEGGKVATKEIPLREEDNDIATMVITPDPLCVESGRTANLSVIGNEFVDLSAIEWSSSDISVANVSATGLVTAGGEGPARITASMIVDQQVIVEAFATLDVRQYCASISTPVAPAKACVHVSGNPAFGNANNSMPLEAIAQTPQAGFGAAWTATAPSVLSVQPTGNASAIANGLLAGTTTVELTVDNVVTEYHATLPVDVYTVPDDYRAVRLKFPYDPAVWAGLKQDRELVPSETLTAMLDEAVARCGIGGPALYDRMSVYGWHESGKVVGEYIPEVSSNIEGFVFDTVACTLNFFVAPIVTPLGDDNFSHVHPLDINADGTIVGWVHFQAYGNWCDTNPEYTCSYSVNTAFVYENASIRYPFLNVLLKPYDPTAFNPQTGLNVINDNRQALAWSTDTYIQGLYALDDPLSPTNPLSLDVAGEGAIDNHGHVVGRAVPPWFYGGGTYVNLAPQFVGSTQPSYLYPVRINDFEDVLAYGGDMSPTSVPDWYFLYLCPLPVESPNVPYIDNLGTFEGFELQESSCDGRDNDLDGVVDNGLDPPLASKQLGVCAGAVKVCKGIEGWMNDYSAVAGYEFPEQSCDTLDNDCDGIPDEECPAP